MFAVTVSVFITGLTSTHGSYPGALRDVNDKLQVKTYP